MNTWLALFALLSFSTVAISENANQKYLDLLGEVPNVSDLVIKKFKTSKSSEAKAYQKKLIQNLTDNKTPYVLTSAGKLGGEKCSSGEHSPSNIRIVLYGLGNKEALESVYLVDIHDVEIHQKSFSPSQIRAFEEVLKDPKYRQKISKKELLKLIKL